MRSGAKFIAFKSSTFMVLLASTVLEATITDIAFCTRKMVPFKFGSFYLIMAFHTYGHTFSIASMKQKAFAG
jgi:hypothetical protein